MKTLTALSIALVMAFAVSGSVSFTSTPAHAGDDVKRGWDCFWGIDHKFPNPECGY